MTVTYYSYTAEKNRIDKSGHMTQIGSASGVPVDAVDVITPSVLVEAAAPSGANYAYIDTFDCWYWITEITCDTGSQTIISMRRDPLMTFKTAIKNCKCVCDRTATPGKYTLFVADPKLRTNQYTHNETIPGSQIFGYNGRFILITTG